MKEYQGFAISNFRTGFNEAVEPWLLPRDAFQSLINATLYRGVVEKVSGYSLYAKMTYRNFISLGTPDGVVKTFVVMLPTLPVTDNFYAFGEIIVGTSAETFTYDSDGVFPVINLVGSSGGTGTVNVTTGAVSISFNTAPPAGTYSTIFFEWDSAVRTSGGDPGPFAIMGIKQYYNSTGSQNVLVFDERRVGLITTIESGTIGGIQTVFQAVEEIQHDYNQSAVFTGDGVTATFITTGGGANATALHAPIIPRTVVINQYTSAGVSTVTDNGFGGLVGSGVASGSINYFTGNYTITFTVPPTNGNLFDSIIQTYGDLFSGGISNFFSVSNYQYKAFFTNNVDPIFYYDGIGIHYLNTNLTVKRVVSTAGIPAYDISRALHVFTNRERLLLINVVALGVLQVNYIYWSTVLQPTDFTDGGELPAPTSESIRAIGYINSDLIVRFANSERIFRYTGDAFSPFRFDSTNNVWACDASYGTINYDSWFSSVGKPAIVGSDGVNVTRADEIMPDFTDPYRLVDQTPIPYMNQTSIEQCYGERFDDIKEGWLCYNSNPLNETGAVASDHVLAFNYLDSTYAVYSFPLSCLGYGFGRNINIPTWGTIFDKWENLNDTWGSYSFQTNSLINLGGDQFDTVYQLNVSNTQTVAGDETITPVPVLMSAVTKNFNPFIEEGQLARLGYVDVLVTANGNTKLRVQFYINDQLYVDSNNEPAGYYQETVLQFNAKDAMSPNTNQTKVWKRIYIGSVAKEHTIRFYQNIADFEETNDQPVYLHAMVLYFKPAGRIFN